MKEENSERKKRFRPKKAAHSSYERNSSLLYDEQDFKFVIPTLKNGGILL